MRSLQIIENYLVARGCEIQKVKDHLVEFRLQGETSRTPGGRLSLARDLTNNLCHSINSYCCMGLAGFLANRQTPCRAMEKCGLTGWWGGTVLAVVDDAMVAIAGFCA